METQDTRRGERQMQTHGEETNTQEKPQGINHNKGKTKKLDTNMIQRATCNKLRMLLTPSLI